MPELNTDELALARIEVAGSILAAMATNGSVNADNIESVGQRVLRMLGGASTAAVEPQTTATPKQEPAVPIKKSVQPDYLVCLEDGKKLKSLKRYLRTHFDLTPEQYREKWGLPKDYPMVAPNYSASRSALAKQMGLGRKPGETREVRAAAAAPKTAKRGGKPAAPAAASAH